MDELYKQTRGIYDALSTKDKASLKDNAEGIARKLDSYLVVAQLQNILLVITLI